MTEFVAFEKMARWSRDIIITEKIDGTNACVFIGEAGEFITGSRTRWITPADDNAGFSAWAHEHRDDLMLLGPGRHFGEWWGAGIQRRYGIAEKRFSLFNVSRWTDERRPACCHVVPTIYCGPMEAGVVERSLRDLADAGSAAAPGFMDPEGIVVFHTAAGIGFKKTIRKDELPKGLACKAPKVAWAPAEEATA